KRYKVQEILRDKTGKIKPDEILSIRDKSNSCLIFTEDVTYANHVLTFARRDKDQSGAEKVVTENVKVDTGAKVVLFLESENQHYGWFASPARYDDALVAKIKKP